VIAAAGANDALSDHSVAGSEALDSTTDLDDLS
jgi:hypothetical protein